MNGSYKLLYILSGGEYYPIGCLTSNSFSESVSVIDSSTRDNSDGWGSSKPTRQSYNISFSGILTTDDRGATIIKYSDLVAFKRARTKIQWKIYSSEGGDTEEGYGYITSISDSSSVDEAITFDGEILGTGNPSTTTWTPPDPIELVDMIPYYELGKI